LVLRGIFRFDGSREAVVETESVSVLDLLEPMCISRESPNMELISGVMETSKNKTENIIMKAQVLLVRVQFLHNSMSDFLKEPLKNEDESTEIDASEADKKLAKFRSENLDTSDFVARNVMFH